ncbi:hypothetical protein KY346_06825 [Candidatus Woesearchaeota archaeon]|nr:hypothetical protein [Candidatus Woesearchaeota archaeon]
MSDFFEEFQEFRKILCVCPCCGELVRVSDLRLKTKGPAAKTWLDGFEDKVVALQKKEERFEEQEEKLREIAREKGRKEAETAVKKHISPELKALKLDPYDVKPILNPIDFVAFKGMTKKETAVDEVIFLWHNLNNPILKKLRNQVMRVIYTKKYDWQVARIDENGKIKLE